MCPHVSSCQHLHCTFTHAQIAQVQVQKEGSEPSGLARLEMERDGAFQNGETDRETK